MSEGEIEGGHAQILVDLWCVEMGSNMCVIDLVEKW